MSYQDISLLIITEIIGDFGYKKFADNGQQYTFTYSKEERDANPNLILLKIDPSSKRENLQKKYPRRNYLRNVKSWGLPESPRKQYQS